jgi:glycosyltransferase involved in cell wall biosynthesis
MAMPAAAPATGIRRVAIVAPSGESLRQLQGTLLPAIVARRHRILAIAPAFAEKDARALDTMGAERAVFAAESSGLRLFADWKAIGALKAILAGWAPHVVMGCGSKAMIFAALAAKGAGVDRVVLLVNALPEHRFAGALAPDEMPAWRYGQAMRAADEAVFYNRDDVSLLKRLGIMPPALPASVVPGAGVDLERRAIVPLPPLTHGLVFLMIATLDKRKGVIEYCEAARELRERAPNTRFLLAGDPGEGAFALRPDDLSAYGAAVEYLGPAEDMGALLTRCHVFVYPSYAEGMPQPVLEAMAAGRPIVTTDVAGCRDTVDERVNGCLVKARDAHALAAAMESFLKRPDLIAPIARASRAKAERFCRLETVNRPLLAALGLE